MNQWGKWGLEGGQRPRQVLLGLWPGVLGSVACFPPYGSKNRTLLQGLLWRLMTMNA